MSERVFLDLDGMVTLDEFLPALRSFDRILATLTKKFVPKGTKVSWQIDSLAKSSAMAGLVAVVESNHDDPRVVPGLKTVCRATGEIAQAMQAGVQIPYGKRIEGYVVQLSSLINGHVSAVTMGNDKVDGTLSAPIMSRLEEIEAAPRVETRATQSVGTVRGVAEILDRRGTLHFFVWDLVYDKAVRCILEDGQEDLIRDLWGRYVDVEGTITRDAASGRPRTIRNIVDLREVQPAEFGAWQAARGIWPKSGRETPSEQILRLRDAQ